MARWHDSTAALLITLFIFAGACRRHEEYPSQPIRLICPWAVGGGTDRISRQVALFLQEELDVPVNVVNITGGGGITGHRHGAEARPDGYTLTMFTVEINMFRWRDLTDLSWEDFAPVALINTDPAALFERTEDQAQKWTNLSELTEYVRENPRALTASGTAAGGIWHLALAGWLRSAGLKPGDIKWIPMNGAGPSLQELVSGGIDLVGCSLPEASTLLKAGKVRSLGVMAENRMPGYEDVPTFKEQGFDWGMGAWRGLAFPTGVSPQAVATVSAAVEKILTGRTLVNGQKFPDVMRQQGFTVSWAGAEKFREMLTETDRELARLLRSEEFLALRKGESFRPMTFPRLLIAGLVLTLALLVIGLGQREDTETRGVTKITPKGWNCFASAIAAVALFILIVERVGFILSAAGIVFFLLWGLGTRLWVSAVVTALLVPSVYELFANWLKVPLPRGWLGW